MLWEAYGQFYLWLAMVYAGFVCGLFYTLCRLLRAGRHTAAADIIFVVLSAGFVWLWVFAVSRLCWRWYYALGLVCGFAAWLYGPDTLLRRLYHSRYFQNLLRRLGAKRGKRTT